MRVSLTAALDNWAIVRAGLRDDQAGASDSTRSPGWLTRSLAYSLGELLGNSKIQERLTLLKELAKSARMTELPAVSVQLLGTALLNQQDPTGGPWCSARTAPLPE